MDVSINVTLLKSHERFIISMHENAYKIIENIHKYLLWTNYNCILFTGSHEKMDYAAILKALHG